ncbi:DUF2460 domain-containing protein [Dehalococcoidia bacterium]|nr:DUF2460 domain-containing protein [Dehalococcoidia bacterium]
MSVYKGWNGELKLNIPEGPENIGIGNGTTTTFGPVAQKNSDGSYFADTTGDGLKNSQDVSVYLGGVRQETTAYTINTATGEITFSTPPGSGVAVTINYAYEMVVGRCQGVNFDVDYGMEPVRAIGRRTPLLIKEGPIEITGTIDKLFVDNAMLRRVEPARDTDGHPTEQFAFILDIEVTTSGGAKKHATLSGVKFESYSREMPQDDFVTESIDFQAIDIMFAETA